MELIGFHDKIKMIMILYLINIQKGSEKDDYKEKIQIHR